MIVLGEGTTLKSWDSIVAFFAFGLLFAEEANETRPLANLSVQALVTAISNSSRGNCRIMYELYRAPCTLIISRRRWLG
jgi:hypothetical protein